MEQQPEQRLDEDLEIDPETAENVNGGMLHFAAKFEGGDTLHGAAERGATNRGAAVHDAGKHDA